MTGTASTRDVTTRPDGVTVVTDTSPARVDAVRDALKALVTIAAGRRSWAVLGPLEPGVGADDHDSLGRLAVRLDVSRLVVVGAAARAIHLGALLEGSWADESQAVPDGHAALDVLPRELRSGDVVLVHAPAGSELTAVAGALVAADAARGGS